MKRGILCAAALAALGLAPAALAGSTVYAFDNRGDAELLTFDVDAPANNVIAGPLGYTCFAMDFDSAATTLYAANTVAPISYGTINQVTGAFTPIGALGLAAGENPTGIKVDPTDETHWLSTAVGGVNKLYKVNPVTGAATFHADMTGLSTGGIAIDIAISNSGQMFAHDIANDSLYSVDKTTGAATLLGATGFLCNFAQGMDFDYATGKLYATLYLGGGAGRFVELNTTTGAATVITDTTSWNKEMEMAVKAAIPEPASLLLLALGGLALGRRR
jgi:hypothetical protein